MNPEDITLTNTTQQFEYEKISRDIDACNNVETLQEMCKFLVKLEMKTRANYSVMLHDMLPDLSTPNKQMELNDTNVIEVLSEMLPYIEADGGWLEYVETDYLPEGAYVKVRLGGACSTCAYSSQTIKMGIEKKLMMEIPDVAGVIQVLQGKVMALKDVWTNFVNTYTAFGEKKEVVN